MFEVFDDVENFDSLNNIFVRLRVDNIFINFLQNNKSHKIRKKQKRYLFNFSV